MVIVSRSSQNDQTEIWLSSSFKQISHLLIILLMNVAQSQLFLTESARNVRGARVSELPYELSHNSKQKQENIWQSQI